MRGITDQEITEDPVVTGLKADSRKVRKGDVFFAIKGEHHDGLAFAEDALKKGAVAVVSERPVETEKGRVYVVDDIHLRMAEIADRFYGHPSGSMHLVGVTGTNGKTTVTYLIREMLEHCGKRAGLLGTIKYITGDVERPASLTTPDAVEFQKALREMIDSGLNYAAVEVSSHALSLRRVDFTDFEVSVFTNLSRDHLDFHHHMEDYFRAKARLFGELTKKTSVINGDDPAGKRLIAISEESGLEVVTYGLGEKNSLKATGLKTGGEGASFVMCYKDLKVEINTPMIGKPNVYNALAATAAALSLGVEMDVIKGVLESFNGVPGRMEVVSREDGFLSIVDYAHTPDALEKVLIAAREVVPGRVILVFGCGGNRDRGKRPEMGRIAEELSDLQIVTSDNPRYENPDVIIGDILGGMRGGNVIVVPDRREAIYRATELAKAGDLVMVAGKGHENYQEIEGVRYPFSDREVLIDALKERRLNRSFLEGDSPAGSSLKGGIRG
ncbi:MAG: UDP-N-acetylmuramoyl-L-alanyl-D-glutamate--2,6-diaminopimelate ligase [Nitrospirae bacterium]|nr:MAG: UDP-N-acetylmuramoyl-L-alanyl-D-glutamate--2,6-diaminopimelate ligase [Nitrospirota bacterium]